MMKKTHWLGVGLALASLAIAGGSNQACGGKKSAIMLAVNTDMKAPKDVNAVSVTISTNNTVKHNVIGRVTPQGEILLPATLAVVEPDEENASIRIRVMAFQERKARVLRDVRTSIPAGGRVVLLRIPLNFVNDGSTQGTLPDNVLPAPNPGTGGGGGVGGGGSSGADGGSLDGGSSSGGSSGSSGGGTSGGTPSAGGDTFDPFTFVPNCPNPEETWIDGECKDAYVDPNTLPDFDESLVGSGDIEAGNCFDVKKCFAEATPIGEGEVGTDVPPDAGSSRDPIDVQCSPDRPCDEGQRCIEGKCVSAFKSEPGKKDFRPQAITIDKSSCTISLNGADASKLNLAIVTPETGECIQPGRCYIPLDKGAAFNVEGGQVKLPSYVCKLLSSKGLSLAASTTCASKEEKNPICLDKAVPSEDGGVVTPGGGLVAAAEFPTSLVVTVDGLGVIEVGSADGVGQIRGSEIVRRPEIPAEKLPWRFWGDFVTTGTNKAYVVRGGLPVQTILFPDPTQTNGASNGLFAIGGNPELGGIYQWSEGGEPSKLNLEPPIDDATVVAATPSGFVYGDSMGNVVGCSTAFGVCGMKNKLGPGRVDAFASKSSTVGYALIQDALYRSTVINQQTGQIQATSVFKTNVAGITEGGKYFPRGLVTFGSCLIFSSQQGISWLNDDGGGSGFRPAIPERSPDPPVLGLSIGRRPTGGDDPVLYYAVFAPKSEGGGVYFMEIPSQCKGNASEEDAGSDVLPDAGGGGGTESGVCLPNGFECVEPQQCCSMQCAGFLCVAP